VGLKYCAQRRTIAEEAEDRSQGYALWRLGDMYADLGEKEQAVASYQRSIELLQAIENPYTQAVRRWLAKLEA
jgi:tetratricopeptide (TPR) repeat protein